MIQIRKYPRTQHIEGSRLQPGDEDLSQVPFRALLGRHLVVEEKVDGANAGLRFTEDGTLVLQSRGHALTGGARERHFNLLKSWAGAHQDALRDRLGARYVVYGEWLYARHTVYYDQLPHYFMEFDILDLERDVFLDTPSRRALLDGLPVVSVPVLHQGPLATVDALAALIRPSLYKSPDWRASLRAAASRGEAARSDPERVVRETDPSDLAEGLYLKVEEGGAVTGRYKYIRPSFLTAVLDSGSHWLDRPIVENGLAPGVDLFGGAS